MIEEFFISRLNKGDAFILAGRVLEIVNIKEQEVQVKLSSKNAELQQVTQVEDCP